MRVPPLWAGVPFMPDLPLTGWHAGARDSARSFFSGRAERATERRQGDDARMQMI